MFLGSIPNNVSFFLAEAIKGIDFTRAIVPCSGNFVIEQTLRSKGPGFPIHGYDVNVYSCCIGSYFSNLTFQIKIIKEEYKFLEPFQDGLDKAAKIAFLSELSRFAKLKHEHDRREYSRIFSQRDKIIASFKDRMEKIKKILGNYIFHPSDMANCFSELCENTLVVFDPPFWKGGYEKMYKFVDNTVSWEKPHYTELSKENFIEIVNRFVASGCKIFIVVNDFKEDLLSCGMKPVYIFEKAIKNRFIVYSNTENCPQTSRYVFKEQVPRFKMFDDEHEITAADKIEIVQVPPLIGNHYRNMWVKKAIMARGGCSFLLTINDMIFGMLQVYPSWLKIRSPGIVLSADPAIPSSRYKRLSKLVTMVLLTEEFKKIIDDCFVYEHEEVYTKVVTNYHVSMRYRGLLKMKSKKKAGDEENYNYVLSYEAKLGRFKLKNVIGEWLQKYELPAQRNKQA